MKSKIAVYPGTFDPLTNGHVDIVKRSLALFDNVIIAVAVNSKKQSLFSVEERIALIENVLKDEKKLIVTQLEGLTADFCKEKGAVAIIRGLRAVADFDYEYAISILNKKLASDVDTVFFMASGENSFISSSMVKEVARYGKNVNDYVPEEINIALIEKYKQLQSNKEK
ncbi:MAG: pantetheine-phosphate adenylyltransferase [Spirochaetia bacterium]|nr:pantetheine-phosphate adenylyltransferase [Spirochaetia bacterium]